MNGLQGIVQLNFKEIHFRDKRFDKRAISDAIDHLANYLDLNIHSSSPFVLLATYTHIKSVIAFYAIIKAGKIPAIMDPGCRSIELTEIIEDIDPAAIIFINASEISFHYEEEIVFRKQDHGFVITSDLRDVCAIAFTNAEDGFSKGAMLTENNLLSEINALILTNRLTDQSVTCALLPFSHLFGLVQGILVPTHAGSTGVIIELDLLRITEIILKIRQYGVTHLYTIPSLYYLFSKVEGIRSLTENIHEFYSGGTQLSSFIFEGFYRKTNRKIREGYGLTESSPGVTLNYEEEGPVMTSIGIPMPGCEIKIFDAEGKECKTGIIGEICVRGEMVFKGYLNNPDATKEVLKDGWLFTGDYGRKDVRGYIYFCGLKKDMINVAGNNVYPKKLERMIKTNKNVAEINIFKEDSVLQGHVVGAKIRLHKSNDNSQLEFKNWCLENINIVILPKKWLFE